MEKPKGKVELINPMLFARTDNHSFPDSPLLDDEQLMYITSHIDDSFALMAHQSKFIDLDKLLSKYNKSFNQEESQKVELTVKDGQAFYIPKEEKVQKIVNVHMWEKGFRLYMALYAQKHPARVPEMIQYISTIQLAASKYTWENVAYYDNIFRHWMEKNPNRNWGKTLNQMWNMSMCDPLSVSRMQQGGSSGKFGRKDNKGVCWRFNKGICNHPQCRYPHKCTYCGGKSHGAHVCFKKAKAAGVAASGAGTTPTPSSASQVKKDKDKDN